MLPTLTTLLIAHRKLRQEGERPSLLSHTLTFIWFVWFKQSPRSYHYICARTSVRRHSGRPIRVHDGVTLVLTSSLEIIHLANNAHGMWMISINCASTSVSLCTLIKRPLWRLIGYGRHEVWAKASLLGHEAYSHKEGDFGDKLVMSMAVDMPPYH